MTESTDPRPGSGPDPDSGPGPGRRSLPGLDGRAVYGATLAVLVAATVLAVAVSPGAGGGPAAPDVPRGEYRVTDDGTRYTVHPSELVRGCPGGRDCIPSIDDPRFQSADSAGWLAPDDRVIGVEVDGEARAYPLRVLNVHEVVNDRVAGRPIAVTYCPLCRSGLVFSREVRGETLSFGVSGRLLNANLVLYDRQTGTYWSQVRGEAIVGRLVPTELAILPSSITTWEEWRRAHPDTRVLSRDTGIYPPSTYGSNPYAGYADSDSVGFGVDSVDGRLPAKRVVYGVAVGGNATAYPEPLVRGRDAIEDEVGGVPVLVVEDDAGGVSVFVRRTGDETLSFERTDRGLVDGDGNRWSFEGEALEGPHAGERLDRLNTHGFYWFAWSSFHPGTDVYGDEDPGE